jgi:uncharacterized membrane protein YccC
MTHGSSAPQPSSPGRTARASRGLTDDVLTLVPRARSVRDYLREGVDQLASADPGLTQLRVALQAVLGIGLGVGLAYAFVTATGALQPKVGPAAVVQAEDHALLIVSMLISAMVAMMAGFTVTDRTARGQLATTLFLPFPMLAAMTIGITLGPYRIVSLIWLVVLLSSAVYVRRFGPRGVAAGLVMFNGGFLGFFLHAELRPRDVGWLAALLGVGVLASLVVRFALFRPNLARTLKRMRRSWDGRAKRMLALSAAVLQAPDAERRRPWSERLARQQVRLNECTLMIDAQLVESVPDSADVEAQRLFDADLALSNIARFAGALANRCADEDLRSLAQATIEAVLQGDEDAAQARATDLKGATSEDPRLTVVAHRLAGSIRNYLAARHEIRAAIADRTDREPTEFTPAVTLSGGWLPGSGPISTEASTTRGRGGPLDHATMPPYVRGTIQVAVAATIAIVVGDIVSGQRLYWAVLATFLAFMATTNSGEQVRKALFRVGGTAIGIIVGDVLVHVTGGHVWSSLIIVMIALFLGIYLVRVNYTFMAIGITVTLSQLYAQLDEFSWHLLLLRLGETAIGVGAVIVTVLLVVPLRPQRVLTTGVLLWFRALSALMTGALSQALNQSSRGEHASLRPEIRELDAAYAALEAAAAPLRRTMFGRNSAQLAEIRSVSSAARHYARSFAVGVQSLRIISQPTESQPDTALRFAAAADQFRESMAAIEHRIFTGDHGTFTRSASLIEQASRSDDPRTALVLRDLTLLDGALARLATALQMTVVDYDTTGNDPAADGTAVDAGRAIADHS